jgi:hypothetical protein
MGMLAPLEHSYTEERVHIAAYPQIPRHAMDFAPDPKGRGR